MKTPLSYDERVMHLRIGRLLAEAVQDEGGDVKEIDRQLLDSRLKRRMGLFVAGKLRKYFPAEHSHLVFRAVPEGWTVVHDVERSDFKAAEMKYVPLLTSDEQYVTHAELLVRAKDRNAVLGLADAETIMRGYSAFPPTMHGKRICLVGTIILDDEGGERRTHLVSFGSDGWQIEFPYTTDKLDAFAHLPQLPQR